MSQDSAFGRLTQAWNDSGKPALAALARRGIESLGWRSARRPVDPDRVLWLREAGDAPAREAVTSLARGRTNYRIEGVAELDVMALAERLHRDRPRFLVVDVRWCERTGPAALRELHRHAPGTDWILRWDAPSPRWLDALVACGARGVIEHGADDSALARVFDAVHVGELWLPRQVMKWLYATIVEPHPPAEATGPSSLTSHWPADSELTAREAEVAGLMRHGLTNREIAERLGVSVNTVKKHLGSAYEKMGIRSRRQIVG
jgi:DNA-binding NarL/FixJ family response regulator